MMVSARRAAGMPVLVNGREVPIVGRGDGYDLRRLGPGAGLGQRSFIGRGLPSNVISQ